MNSKVIFNCRVFDGKSILHNSSVLIRNGIIDGIYDRCVDPTAIMIDAHGALIAPSFIDLQVNGGGGILFTDKPTTHSLGVISKAHEKYGVLNYLPTLISTDTTTIVEAIQSVKEYSNTDDSVLGLHIEGPYLDASKAGIHNSAFIHACSISELEKLYGMSQDIIKIMTIAPESCGLDCIDYMVSHGTKVFIGHSNATFSTAKEYFNNGISGCTHLFNAMSQLQGREPGIVGACFEASDIWAGIIADGFHVDFASIRIAKKIKGNKLFLVTDAMPPVGIGNFDYRIGETQIHCIDGKCTSDSGTIAGSALNMNAALKNVVFDCGIDIVEALRMTSTYQAHLLGMDNQLGYIRNGCIANLVALNESLDVVGVIKHGELINWGV